MGASVLERPMPHIAIWNRNPAIDAPARGDLAIPIEIDRGGLSPSSQGERGTYLRIELLDTCFVVPAWPSPRRLLRTSLRPHSCRSRISDRQRQGECRESLIVVPRQTKKTALVRQLRGPAGPSRVDARPARVAANPRWQQMCS